MSGPVLANGFQYHQYQPYRWYQQYQRISANIIGLILYRGPQHLMRYCRYIKSGLIFETIHQRMHPLVMANVMSQFSRGSAECKTSMQKIWNIEPINCLQEVFNLIYRTVGYYSLHLRIESCPRDEKQLEVDHLITTLEVYQ